MNNDEEIQDIAESERENYGLSSYFEQDAAFCARMRAAIAAGLEHAPIGVVTTPGTKNPKFLAAEPLPLTSSQRAVEDTYRRDAAQCAKLQEVVGITRWTFVLLPLWATQWLPISLMREGRGEIEVTKKYESITLGGPGLQIWTSL